MVEKDNKLDGVISALKQINETITDSTIDLFSGIDDSLKQLATAFDTSVSRLSTAFSTVAPAVTAPAAAPMPVAAPAAVNVGSILGANDNSSRLVSFAFSRLKRKLLKNIEKNLPTEFEFDRKLSIGELLGQSDKDSYVTALSFAALKLKLLSRLRNNVPKTFDWSTSIDVAQLLGQNDKDSRLTALSFALLKHSLIKAIKANIPKEFEFDQKLSIGDIFGTLPQADIFFQFRLAKLRHDILSMIQKAIKAGGTGGGITGPTPVEAAAAPGPGPADAPTILQKLLEVTQLGFATNEVLLEQMLAFFRGDSLQKIEDSRENASIMQKLLKAAQGSGVTGAAPAAGGGGGGFLGVIGKVGPVLGSLGSGIAAFGKGIGRGIGKLIEGVMLGLARGLRYLSNPKLLIGVAVLAALGAAMYIAGKGFKQFGETSWGDVLIGSGVLVALSFAVSLMGRAAPRILIGAAAMLVLSAAIGVAGFAFQQFADINWANVLIGLAVLAGVGVIAALIAGAAPLLIIGSVAIAALGAAMIPAAYAFKLFSESLDTGKIAHLASIDGSNLLVVAAGITALGVALAAFAAGTFISGLASFFSSDPVKPFERFAAIGTPLSAAAEAISKITQSLNGFDTSALAELGKGLLGMAKAVSSDAFIESNVMSVLNGFGPISEYLQKAANGMREFTSEFSKLMSMVSDDNVSSFDLFISKVYELSSAVADLAGSFNKIDGEKLKIIAPALSPAAMAMDNQSGVIDGVSAGGIGITGEQLHYGSIENEESKDANRVNMMMPFMMSGGPKTSSVKTNNVTYNVSNHVDQTMQKVIFDNRF